MTGLLLTILLTSPTPADDAPLLVRARNFLVPPSTGPVTHIQVKNPSGEPFSGNVATRFPDGWTVSPASHIVDLAPGETKLLPFTIESGADVAENAYPVAITVNDGAPIEQTVVCASGPYGSPKIDGKLNEWHDTIPLTIPAGDFMTTVRTLWDKRCFSLAVEVEEAELQPGDALQFALATPPEVPGEANRGRYEFLVVAGARSASCYRLNRTGADLPRLAEPKIAVRRQGATTRYEIAVPFALMPDIRATPGREICFSLLVHDPDGTGLRDLGSIMNLWEESRIPDAWSEWAGDPWPHPRPFTGSIEFGLCSSIH